MFFRGETNVLTTFEILSTGDYGVFHGMNGILLGDEPFEPCPLPDFVSQVAWTGEYNTLLGFLVDPALQAGLASVGPISKYTVG